MSVYQNSKKFILDMLVAWLHNHVILLGLCTANIWLFLGPTWSGWVIILQKQPVYIYMSIRMYVDPLLDIYMILCQDYFKTNNSSSSASGFPFSPENR